MMDYLPEMGEIVDVPWTHNGKPLMLTLPKAFLAELRAERDAALAAIERVRALVTEWKHEGPSAPFPDRIAIDVGVEVIEPLLTALDGAPEPEEKP